MYENDTLTALEAITEAQRISFAPMLFQTALCLRRFGILEFLDQRNKQGATLEEITAAVAKSEYAVSVLLDMGLSGRIVTLKNGQYYLAKVGYFLLHDKMTRVNMDFTQDVCYQGLFDLDNSLLEGKPAGLAVFGDWPTIYPALSQLPEQAKKSWFAFDHFYSDAAFNTVLPLVFAHHPKRIYDVGGNTGKWAIRSCHYNQDVKVTILDLPEQIVLAQENIAAHGLSERIDFHPVNMLSNAELPTEADVWWMSQFLDCFSPEQITQMLTRVAKAMKPGAKLCIMELFWDAQRFEAAAFSLNAISLYFTVMANGNSRFYSAENFRSYVEQAGLKIESQQDNIGLGHSLLICSKD